MNLTDAQLIETRGPVERSRRRVNHFTRQQLYGGGGDGGAGAAAAEQRANLDKGTAQINQVFSKYDQGFYDARGKAYTDWAMPQVTQQYQDTKKGLTYALARNGLLNSGAAVSKDQSLTNQLNQQTNNVANQAQGQMNQLRQDVSNAKSNLTNQLIASNDPTATMANASTYTAGLSATPSFNALGNMFGDWANTYVTNMNARAMNPGTPSIWQQLNMGAYY